MKSTCTFGTLTLPGSLLKQENPYPCLEYDKTPKTRASEEIQRELRLDYGSVSVSLPYTMQDNYNRQRTDVTLKTAVLENDFLKATFLPEYGARLWSLYDKKTQRELLHANTVFQPANLAVRNAWFAGGVEWNIGFRGHSPFTMDKMFCEEGFDKVLQVPVLRFYEWERIRQAAFEICAYLPNDSENLMVRVRIKNCLDKEIPMYWWSNIAVPETIDTRVIVPAVSAYTNIYVGEMTKSTVPNCDRTDITYTATQMNSRDYFFAIPPEEQKFIAAVNRDGFGLLQTSTRRLSSRKLFLWGMRRCYRNWQDMLSEPLNPYLEIQAGIAPTQMECIPMPALAEWDWLESYGPIQIAPEKAHSKDWDTAINSVKVYRNAHAPEAGLEKELTRTKHDWDNWEKRFSGSGWGALEEQRRKHFNETPFDAGLNFPTDSMNAEQQIWLDLLVNNTFPCPNNDTDITVSFMRQEIWLELLEKYLDSNPENWFGWYILGIGHFANDLPEAARSCFEKAVRLNANSSTLRALAQLTAKENPDSAAELISKAFMMKKHDLSLVRDTFLLLLDLNRAEKVLELWEELSDTLKEVGRIKLYELRAAIDVKDLTRCEQILSSPFTVDDLREGESLFATLWYDYCYLKMDCCGIQAEDKKQYANSHYEMPAWLDYLFY